MPQPTAVNVFSGQPLGIFKSQEPNFGTKLEVWESLKQRELSLATLQPPANYFQKMILWTEQGKVWKFPIDNEQGTIIIKKYLFTHLLSYGFFCNQASDVPLSRVEGDFGRFSLLPAKFF